MKKSPRRRWCPSERSLWACRSNSNVLRSTPSSTPSGRTMRSLAPAGGDETSRRSSSPSAPGTASGLARPCGYSPGKELGQRRALASPRVPRAPPVARTRLSCQHRRSREHPTMKPPELERCLRNSTRRRDLVLDPFAGSGSPHDLASAGPPLPADRPRDLAPTGLEGQHGRPPVGPRHIPTTGRRERWNPRRHRWESVTVHTARWGGRGKRHLQASGTRAGFGGRSTRLPLGA